MDRPSGVLQLARKKLVPHDIFSGGGAGGRGGKGIILPYLTCQPLH